MSRTSWSESSGSSASGIKGWEERPGNTERGVSLGVPVGVVDSARGLCDVMWWLWFGWNGLGGTGETFLERASMESQRGEAGVRFGSSARGTGLLW